MEIWIEGSIEEVIAVANSGLVGAIATNPTIMQRWTSGGRSLEDVVTEVCAAVSVPVYVQLHGGTVDDYVREMDHLRALSERIQPKLVATPAGIAATKRIAQSGLKPLVTTIATVNQAFLAASVGAAYVAPYVGRIARAGMDAYGLIADIAALYAKNGVSTQIAAASISSPQDAQKVALAGAPVLVMQHNIFTRLLDSDLTQTWIDTFEEHWQSIPYGWSVR